MNNKSFINLIEQSIRNNWDKDALTDYKGVTLQYKDIARKIEKMHIAFSFAGIKKGDKIALCGRNSANWATAFLAILTYGAVAVPILHEFKPDNIHNVVNHSEARLLLVGDQIWENLDETAMPRLEGILDLRYFDLLVSRSKGLTYAVEHRNEEFGKKYPNRFRASDVAYNREEPDDLSIINYTSGTTGYSKGVMIPYRGLYINLISIQQLFGVRPDTRIVCMLPMGHIFGLALDFLYGFTIGAHIWFLTRMPSPKIIAESFSEIKPNIICSVPLVVEKIFKKNILPKVESKMGRLLLNLPIISNRFKEQIRKEAMEVFGGEFFEIIIGGAPFNPDIETFLRDIKFPYTTAYGMTEACPLICHSRWDELKFGSCGKTVNDLETKVVSENPETIPGELICRGESLMAGYFKNPEATAETIDKDGWLHTGDMAVKDSEGNIYIKGRCKNLLLSSSGQNIYPEEIEAKLNNMPLVNESLVIMQSSKLIALIHPEFNEAIRRGMNKSQLYDKLNQSRVELNETLPPYSQITQIKIYNEEFEKTAKKSIKRFMYH